jgi:hypothetical protein
MSKELELMKATAVPGTRTDVSALATDSPPIASPGATSAARQRSQPLIPPVALFERPPLDTSAAAVVARTRQEVDNRRTCTWRY